MSYPSRFYFIKIKLKYILFLCCCCCCFLPRYTVFSLRYFFHEKIIEKNIVCYFKQHSKVTLTLKGNSRIDYSASRLAESVAVGTDVLLHNSAWIPTLKWSMIHTVQWKVPEISSLKWPLALRFRGEIITLTRKTLIMLLAFTVLNSDSEYDISFFQNFLFRATASSPKIVGALLETNLYCDMF